MNRLTSALPTALIVAGLTLATALPAMAQQQKRISPHECIYARIDRHLVSIVYGRPYSKDPKTGEIRKIWGTLIPYGKVWRTGSDEATLLLTEKTMHIGDLTVPPGCYSVFTLPNEDGTAKLIINKTVGQWGAFTYDAGQDLGRVDLTKSTLDTPLDQFTMTLEQNPAGGGLLNLAWENTKYSVAFTIEK
jgi:hypothetical protein